MSIKEKLAWMTKWMDMIWRTTWRAMAMTMEVKTRSICETLTRKLIKDSDFIRGDEKTSNFNVTLFAAILFFIEKGNTIHGLTQSFKSRFDRKMRLL
jgi:hypothetical protein